MFRFLVPAAILTIGLPPMVSFLYRHDWIPRLPSFLYESTWLAAFLTTIIFVYLYRQANPSLFVQLYLLSMAVKLIACVAYCLLMILQDRPGGGANITYFLVAYILFTALEIALLYRKISRSPGS